MIPTVLILPIRCQIFTPARDRILKGMEMLQVGDGVRGEQEGAGSTLPPHAIPLHSLFRLPHVWLPRGTPAVLWMVL